MAQAFTLTTAPATSVEVPNVPNKVSTYESGGMASYRVHTLKLQGKPLEL